MYSAVRTHDYPESEMDDRESLYFDTISLADSEAAAAAVAHRKSLSQSRNTIYHSAVDLANDETPSRRSELGGSFGRSMAVINSNNNNRLSQQQPSASAIWNATNYRHSSALDHYNGGSGVPSTTNRIIGDAIIESSGIHLDYSDATIAAQVMALHNGSGGGRGRGGVGGGDGSGIPPSIQSAFQAGHAHPPPPPSSHNNFGSGGDEVSRRLLQSYSNSNASTKDKKLPITYSQWKFRTRRRFQDGRRSVDFVLAYDGDDFKLDNIKKREIFEANLEREGLALEHDNTQRIHFIKLHAPLPVLCRYAEILKIKLPVKTLPGEELIHKNDFRLADSISGIFKKLFGCIRFNEEKLPTRPVHIYCEFSRNYEELFDWDQPNLFDAGLRNLIINFILERQHFVEGEETPDNLGIDKLLADEVYDSAYTLHDDTDRDLLLAEWAQIRNCLKLQPLDYIKDYFGPKVALYFAWLGFYTHMLIPLSIYGIICFIYGFVTWHTDPISQQICADGNRTIMCPQCDKNCDYWALGDTCKVSKMNYLIDNNITVAFAFVASIWAVLYLELWKRYSASLVHRWGLTGFSQYVEHPRTQYLAKLQKRTKEPSPSVLTTKDGREIPNNTILEPDIPFWSTKFLPNFTSYSVMILFISVSLIAICSMIVYRMAQRASHSVLGHEDSATYKILVLPLTAGIIDLFIISLLDYLYSTLAVYLTDLEYCRTQTEYDESLTIKNYGFQFVNYYSSLFYIAFLKGKFVGYPREYNRIFTFRQEECAPGGCLMELCVQLIIIMVGKQAVNAIVEMLIPYVTRTIRKRCSREKEKEEKLVSCNQWTEDYHLTPWTNDSMFSEYLEMVLQYGFITLFGLAFPLAPALALLNNMIEVRLDAIKMLNFYRRPVAQRARNIGVWFNIMSIVTKIAVVSSAMIIAFSTNLIPKLVYRDFTNDVSYRGYLNFTLAYFNTADFEVRPTITQTMHENVTTCRYVDFRNPPTTTNITSGTNIPYERPLIYWRILTGRLAFIVIYQNVISILQAVIAWAIPDVSERLRKRIKREDLLLREHIIDYEKTVAAKKLVADKVANIALRYQNQNSSSPRQSSQDERPQQSQSPRQSRQQQDDEHATTQL